MYVFVFWLGEALGSSERYTALRYLGSLKKKITLLLHIYPIVHLPKVLCSFGGKKIVRLDKHIPVIIFLSNSVMSHDTKPEEL